MSFLFAWLICLFDSSMFKRAGMLTTIGFLFGGMIGWAIATLNYPTNCVSDQSQNDNGRQHGETRS